MKLCKASVTGVALLSLGLAACKNPFATREPEPPQTARSRWIPPYKPEDVLENLRNALSDRHVLNYMKCFSDSLLTGKAFRFEPEPSVASTHPDLFRNWGLAEERRYVDQLFQASPVDSVVWLRLDLVSEQVGEAGGRLLVANYSLDVPHTITAPAIPRHFEGRADFWLIREESTSYWYIWRWSDRATSDTPTWSLLKAALGG